MAIPSSGPLTLGDIQTEFGGSNPISLSEYYAGGAYVPAGTTGTYGAVPSSGEISIRNFYGTSAFSLAFNNADNIQIYVTSSGSGPLQAAYGINTDATCTKSGTFTPSPNSGPTAWGSPTGGTPGNSYEVRLNVTAFDSTQASGNYVKFAGVDVSATGFTSWYVLSSNRSIEVYAAGQYASVQGTLYIRNTSTLVEISRAFDLLADLTA
jgi:hypothetical protein